MWIKSQAISRRSFEEISLIKTFKDLDDFKKRYGIEGDVEKIY